ncbi:hypothetical protein EJ04DRAFT_70895 [Polyplosphaeria fusca]|uniref:Uncharacterized protein n=1 Tax=Polyplosphaeria fusca TaxID=682080 RepID=A0A9P4R711_9PLEO|nr:hypothetical protein EJ04DRAFT_70895 [Polyplosphaeria fusca]
MCYGVHIQFCGPAAAILRTQYHQKLDGPEAQGVYNIYLMFRLRDEDHLQPIRPSFLQPLRLTQMFKASIPEDRFYALLGIRTSDNEPGIDPFIQVDYQNTKSLSRDVVERLLQGERPLSFLAHVYPQARFRRGQNWHKPRIYSWLPDWSCDGPSLIGPWDLDTVLLPAKGLPFKRYKDPTIPKSDLAIDGIIFSTVLWASPVDQDPSATACTEASPFFFNLGIFGERSAAALPMISRTLRARRDSYGMLETGGNIFTAHFADLLSQVASPESPLFNEIVQLAVGGSGSSFHDAAKVVSADWSMFFTIKGHFGIGPSSIEVGDYSAILGGGHLPVIIGAATRDPQADDQRFEG